MEIRNFNYFATQQTRSTESTRTAEAQEFDIDFQLNHHQEKNTQELGSGHSWCHTGCILTPPCVSVLIETCG